MVLSQSFIQEFKKNKHPGLVVGDTKQEDNRCPRKSLWGEGVYSGPMDYRVATEMTLYVQGGQ